MSDVSGSTVTLPGRPGHVGRRRSVEALPGVEAYLRRRGSTSQIFGPSSMQDLEQFVKKKRRASMCLIDLGDNESIVTREDSSLSLGRRQYSSGPLWEKEVAQSVEEEKAVPKQKKPRKKGLNLLDKRTLYSITKENIAGKDMPFSDKPIIGEGEHRISNIEQKIEREYILNARLRDNGQAKFEGAIMRHFFKAPAPKAHPGYGMPRPETREENPFKLMMNDLQRDPSIVKVNKYPSLSNPKRCQNTSDFCEVLGPSTCSTCIEQTNRNIADELQRIMFPKIDMNRTRLVKPKLSRVMRNGHFMQVRKKKMGELDYPSDIVMSLCRHEPQLTHVAKSAVSRYTLSRKSKKGKKSSKTHLKPEPLNLAFARENEQDCRKLQLATR